jgi:hypothetical protein
MEVLKCSAESVHNASLAETNTSRLPSDLTEVVATWPELPKHIKTVIKVLVQAHIKEVW